MNWRVIEVTCFLFIWGHITVQSSRQDPSVAEHHVSKQFDWLISDRGPFHHARSYLSFVDRFRQGFTTRYKIYREFARWKVRNTAIERRDLIRNPVPLMPEFQRSVRLLGRRPSTQQFIETIIKKYGTHLLISATLGGEEALTMFMAKSKLDRKSMNASQSVEALHQLASSYFIDRDGTMRKLHEIQISTNAIKRRAGGGFLADGQPKAKRSRRWLLSQWSRCWGRGREFRSRCRTFRTSPGPVWRPHGEEDVVPPRLGPPPPALSGSGRPSPSRPSRRSAASGLLIA
ncbi:hypothetical protein ANANG_G00269900 [Anguilla anguilla]|uniref:BMP/retinoic acid-inducible neural-specific protein 1 n=1 Tax=Anguilla anguilla TaxID=7936 RepID=A0A9D3LRW7_ANGAN|nr:hypothetical protein ANANG_G00269900 [Anguilla anguilla]